jgi:hypothetical protein
MDNARINEHTISNMKKLGTASYAELTSRIHKLQWEWDIERVIEAAAAGIILIATLVIGVMRRHTWLGLGLAAAEASFIMLHATYGWCPPQPVLRKFGFRTSYEIMDELVALRLLRGDFDPLIGGTETAAFREGRKSEMLDSMIRNMRDSGRLLGAF